MVDAGVCAAAAVAFVVARAVAAAPAPPPTAGLALTVLAVAPLAWRRRAALAALAAALGAGAAVVGAGEPEIGLALVGLVLALSAAAGRDPDAPPRRVAAVVVVGWAAQTVAAAAVGGGTGEVVSAAAGGAVLLALATALGDNLRRRRQHLRDLEERVAAAERARELEVRNAVVSERLRIARELHDVVAHAVSLVVVQSGAGQRVARRDPDGARAALADVERTGRGAMVQLRALLDVLRDGVVAPAAPQPGLDQLRALVEEDRELGARLVEDGSSGAVPDGVGLHAYRIVQEALTNARRHAPGARVEVTLSHTGRELVVAVADSGAARPRRAPDGPGHGLVGMRERAQLCGGVLHAGPRTGAPGWCVEARLPT